MAGYGEDRAGKTGGRASELKRCRQLVRGSSRRTAARVSLLTDTGAKRRQDAVDYLARRRRERRCRRVVKVGASALVLFFAVSGLGQLFDVDGSQSDVSVRAARGVESVARFGNSSTPKAQWRKGEMPYLYQTDPTWSQKPYAGSTIEKSGCGPTSLAMVYVYLTGKRSIEPVKMARLSEDGGYVESQATKWTFMSEEAASLGLVSTELYPDSAEVERQLAADRPVICIVGPGDFTETGHFIVLCAINEDGTVEIRDPNSPSNSQRSWDLDRILRQCRNLWAYSV